MLATPKAKVPLIRQSKIIHKSPRLHPLARFVTEEATAAMFDINVEDIERIECCYYMVYVHGVSVSRFVSYADYPAGVSVALPTERDFRRWRRRWRKRWGTRYAPDWWQKFYINQLHSCEEEKELNEWRSIVDAVKTVLSESAFYSIAQALQQEKLDEDNLQN